MSLKQRVESEHIWSSDILPVMIEQWCVLITIVILLMYSHMLVSILIFGPVHCLSHLCILGHICRWIVAIAAAWELIIIMHVTTNTSDQKDTDYVSLSLSIPLTLLFTICPFFQPFLMVLLLKPAYLMLHHKGKCIEFSYLANKYCAETSNCRVKVSGFSERIRKRQVGLLTGQGGL